MTAAETQAALRAIAFGLVRLGENCQAFLDLLPQSDNEEAMLEGRSPRDLLTHLRTTWRASAGQKNSAGDKILGESFTRDRRRFTTRGLTGEELTRRHMLPQ